ncbi:MAG: metallophosphoesterase family protein [Lachnospiraceae bacterium]|nr:metallophosphoesterase family protein [Lachnospiraceae bacterium]
MRGEPIRAAVISDTHGLLRPEVERVLQTCDVIIHAGDFDNQMLYHKLDIGHPLYGVRGNNDGLWAERLPLVLRFELGGISFLMAHERSDIPDETGKAQVVIFGHSHMYHQEAAAGRLWLNPGSCGYRRFTLPLSMAVLTVHEGILDLETVWLKEKSETNRAEDREPELEIVSEMQPDVLRAALPEAADETDSVSSVYGAVPGRRENLREKFERLANRRKPGTADKDRLFQIAKIVRFMNRGGSTEWIAANLGAELSFVEDVCRMYATHPGINAHQILDKLEIKNR